MSSNPDQLDLFAQYQEETDEQVRRDGADRDGRPGRPVARPGLVGRTGERIETKVATIREQLLRSNSTLTCDQAQQRAEQEAIYWMVGVAYLGWEVPDEIHDQLWPTPQPLPTPSRLLHQIHNEERLA